MAIKRLKRAWGWFCNSVNILTAARRMNGHILFLRLENPELLKRRLGEVIYFQLLERISSRISGNLPSTCEILHASDGIFVLRLREGSKTKAMLAARQAQLYGEHASSVSDQTITPVLTGAVLRQPLRVRSAKSALIEKGWRILNRIHDDCLGQITYVDSPAQTAKAQISPPKNGLPPVPLFQPLLCCDTDHVVGFELYTSVAHPVSGTTSGHPAHYVRDRPEAEYPLKNALKEAARSLRLWDEARAGIRYISIELSGSTLIRSGFPTWLSDQLTSLELPASRLAIRLNIDDNLNNINKLKSSLCALRKLGIWLELDRFGAGRSELDMLRRLELDAIRIDPSFVFCCDMDPAQKRTLRAILAMAEQMCLHTIAEGVESPEEHAYLAQLGCRLVQGCAIAPPMPLDETLDFLERHRKRAGSVPNIGPTKFM